jgi:hypothetical protein
MEIGLTVSVTGQQRMLALPRHLILLSFLSEVRVALHSALYFLFWIMITFNTLLTSVFDIFFMNVLHETCWKIMNSYINIHVCTDILLIQFCLNHTLRVGWGHNRGS